MYLSKLRITDVRFGCIFMALFALGSGSVSSYIGAMITTIEKRFTYNSMEIGAIMGANDIGYLLTVIIVAYIASKEERKPIILCFSSIGLYISSMVYTLPYFIFGPRYKVESLIFTNKSITKDLCFFKNESLHHGNITHKADVSPNEKYASFVIYMIAGILNGVASTPFWSVGITFIDDMAGTLKSGVYIGLLYCMRSLAPIFGYLLGSYVLKYHESLQLHVYKYLPGQKDYNWIGAWWLGWLILGFFVLLPAPFLALLKGRPQKTLKDKKTQKVEIISTTRILEVVKEEKSRFINFKDLYSIIKNSIQNKIYVTLLLGMIFEILSFICLFTFFTKFLEFHYRVSTSLTNVLTAFSLAGSSVISALISGTVSHLFKPTIRNMNRYHAIVNTVSALLFPILFIFTCPSASVKGISESSRIGLCSQNCNCEVNKLQPICLNSNSIFSPCLAGCRARLNETFYSDCGCGNRELAYKGFCEGMCNSVYGFLISFFIIKIVGSIASVQYTQVLMSLTEPKNKAVYLALISMIYGICGFILPPLSGLLLDTACIHRDVSSFGTKSHCLIYNNDKIRYLILGVAFALQIPSSIMYILSWIFTPPNYSYEKKDKLSSKIQSEIVTIS